jgi:hypothetical protein
MAGLVLNRSPSVGAVVKKMLEINPDLGAQEITKIVKQAIHLQGGIANEFAEAEVIDEEKALELARQTLRRDS